MRKLLMLLLVGGLAFPANAQGLTLSDALNRYARDEAAAYGYGVVKRDWTDCDRTARQLRCDLVEHIDERFTPDSPRMQAFSTLEATKSRRHICVRQVGESGKRCYKLKV